MTQPEPPVPGLAPPLRARREALLADESRRGRELGGSLAGLVDEALRLVLDLVGDERVAVLALGSYARRELCPGSDVDILLLHAGRRDVTAVADALWYPLWDAGFVLGHAARTPKETLRLADRDLDTLTSLLDVRFVAGALDTEARQVARRARELAERRRGPLIEALADAATVRRHRPGPVAEVLEPNLKDGAGGLRDVHALAWAGWALGEPGGLETLRARGYLHPGDPALLDQASDLLLELRVALHRFTGGRSDVLALEDQDAVAAAVGAPDADALVRALSSAARRVAWIAMDAWDRLRASARGPAARLGGGDRPVGPGVVLRDGRIAVVAESPCDGSLVLRAAAAAAELGVPFERGSLARLRGASSPGWSADDRGALVRLLRTGARAVEVFEALDHEDALVPVLPEWAHVRSLPQRNAYHRFTVDRHLLETVAEAAALLDDPSAPDAACAADLARPDILLLGALLHDIGKGLPGDHAETGSAAATMFARRIGLDDVGAHILEWLVRDHLVMADTATRRDLSDPATISRFATRVGDVDRLRLLALLTVADSRATGPAAWGPAKAALVRELLDRTLAWWSGAGVAEPEEPPQLADVVEADGVVVRWEALGDERLRCTMGAPDRPGLLADVAGALALEGFDIVSASGRSLPGGRAVEVFTGADRFGRIADEPGRERVARTVKDVLAGTLPLEDRLRERRARYRPGDHVDPSTRVQIALDESEYATVVEVHARDEVGLLARVAAVFAAQGLDVMVAKVATMGDRVVDAFYVRDASGKVTDPDRLARLEAALLAAVSGDGD